jgi:hypothetical protein
MSKEKWRPIEYISHHASLDVYVGCMKMKISEKKLATSRKLGCFIKCNSKSKTHRKGEKTKPLLAKLKLVRLSLSRSVYTRLPRKKFTDFSVNHWKRIFAREIAGLCNLLQRF